MINLTLTNGAKITLVPTNNHLPYAFKVEGKMPLNTLSKYMDILVSNLFFFLNENDRTFLGADLACVSLTMYKEKALRDTIVNRFINILFEYIPCVSEDYAKTTATEIENLIFELYFDEE